MDWDRKNPSWDLAELNQQLQQQELELELEPNAGNVARGLDLKLGGSGDLGSAEKRGGASKRARAPSNAAQNVVCLVDGCKADLSGCREYHRRHKVCETHSKTPMVMVGGREQRFCQQCSRFHLLVEFDEVKRSCRKRLDGHNRRRRKPQPDPLSSASNFPVHQGPRFSSYPHIFPTPTPDPLWAALIKIDEDMINRDHRSFHLLERQHHSPPNSTFRIFKEGKQFPFLQDDDAAICSGATIASPACQPLLSAASSSESCSRKVFSNREACVLDADCALSLLSSQSQTAAVNLGTMLPAEGIPFGQPLPQQFRDGGRFLRPQASIIASPTRFSCPRLNAEQVDNIMIGESSDVVNLNCHGFYPIGTSGAIDGHSEALPFSWRVYCLLPWICKRDLPVAFTSITNFAFLGSRRLDFAEAIECPCKGPLHRHFPFERSREVFMAVGHSFHKWDVHEGQLWVSQPLNFSDTNVVLTAICFQKI